MTDINDARIKAKIDGIMKGVKDIMKKIDAVTPKEEPEPVGDRDENQDSSNARPAQNE